jgi:eukaryotic-like serine/threonine-protein kinase
METFGHYTILERLRTGALGELSRARDARLGRTVALRLVSPEVVADPVRRDALLSDASVASTLSHPHIAALFDFGEEGGRIYLAHEYVPGQPLQSLLSAKPFDLALALEFAVELADAVAEGHRHGIVHGDIRPSSILITPTDQTKIVGFGLSQWSSGGIERATIAAELSSGREPSTPNAATIVPYMSPEQVLGDRVDARSDVFSLGVVLYQMLTGRAPFGSDTPGGTAVKILQGTPMLATRQNPALPPGFDAVLSRAMSKSLDARYETAAPLAVDLRKLAGDLNVRVTAEVARQKKQAPSKARRPLSKWFVAAVVAVAVLAGIGAAGWVYRGEIRRAIFRPTPISNPVLVVMPFATADDTSRAYFGVGFAADLASRLGEVPGLTVVGRSTIAEGNGASMADRARPLGAALGLRGSARPGPYSLRVDVELVEAASGKVLWREHYSREPRQASAAEIEIARDLAEQVGLEMPTGNRWARALTRQVDPGAYDFYLQARDAASRRDRAKAISLYRQALGIDPRLIEARVGLSEALYLEDFYSGAGGDSDALERARAEADAALAVDPDMPRAHLVAAMSAPTAIAAASSLAKTLSLDPSNGEAWHHAGDLVIEFDPERAISFYRRSLQLEPGNDANHRDIAAAYEMLGDLPEAERALAVGQAARPDRPWWTQLTARLEIVRKNYDKAAELMAASAATETTPSAWLFGRVVPLKMAGRKPEARLAATRLVDRFPGYCEALAVAAGLDADDNARDKARAAVDAILARASAADARPGILQCAATAAAAIGDGPEAAGVIARLANDDRALRIWTRQAVFSLPFAFRQRLYPFSKVQSSGPFAQASTVLAQSLARLREETARRLPSVSTQ